MASRPGKTAPRLLQDLLSYDPLHPAPNNRNILTNSAPRYADGAQPPSMVARNTCRHSFMNKADQCSLPFSDARPDASTYYKVAAFCQECRCHLDLEVNVPISQGGQACPNFENPLHHFRYVSQKSSSRGKSHGEHWTDEQCFECTSLTCGIIITIRISAPRLTPEFVGLLTDQKKIDERARAAFKDDPERFKAELTPPPVTTVLRTFQTYLSDSLKTLEVKRFSALNKRFLTCLGDPCSQMLKYFGFTYSQADHSWTLPQPDKSLETPTQDPLRILLQDVEEEIKVLLSKRPWQEKAELNIQFLPPPSIKELERSLGCLDYEKNVFSRKAVDLTVEEHPYYASLGAVADFSDKLLLFAYDRQRLCDPDNAPYYLECLQDLAKGRESESLQTQVAIMESEGQISRRDVGKAYAYFQLDPQSKDLDDEYILNVFQSRVVDAPRQESEMRQKLRIIGQIRRSDKIQHVASNTVSTYEQALAWLNADENTGDEFIVTMLTVKLGDNKNDTEIGRNAVSIIAEKRNSEALRSWLKTGELGEVEMDVGQAYTRLGIEDRTLEDDMILTTFEIRVQEAPSQLQDLRQALKAIAKSTGSRRIETFLGTGMVSPEHVPSEWPVGLENIGNTCYLNSLLQFYFTVKPLRNLILDFDQFRMEMTPENLQRKQVGSRKVTIKEVERAQKFVYELQRLFRSLIAARTSSITPEHELARLTLISSDNEEAFRRMSMVSGDGRPSIGEINGAPFIGPLGPPQSSQDMDVDGDLLNQDRRQKADGDNSSEATLVDPPAYDDTDYTTINATDLEQQQQIFEDKENLAPIKAVGSEHPSSPNHPEPLHVSSPSKLNVQETLPISNGEHVYQASDIVMTNGLSSPPQSEKPIAPDRPPPVPPRPKTTEQSKKAPNDVELGAQQDVTEVIANVLFQMQCAVKPLSIDSSGEQIDQIKDLFFGKTRSYIEAGRNIRTKEEFFSDIKVDVASGPRDIYSALDGAFDVQEVVVERTSARQYALISLLPPILQIQVQRVQFDQAKGASYKSDAKLGLEETIYLDRYMVSTDSALMERREESWKWKDQLRVLEARRTALTKTDMDIDLPDALDLAKGYLSSIQGSEDDDLIIINPDLTQTLEQKASEVRDEVRDIESGIKDLKAQIASQFTDLRKLPYRLHSVFIHRGSVSFGHYWIYIHDFERNLWRKYNDGYVTEVKDRAEVFEQDSFHPATPYFLVYVRDSEQVTLVDSVCRDIPPQEPESDPVDAWAGEMETDDQPVQDIKVDWAGIPLGTTHASDDWDSKGAFNPNGW
ncbi:MAG: ubiquitin-specific protease ubp2 [Pycnora praestabilis]|nr:MAG: ubiquitin-specific protease ubp2 [Pycnora praestabilis]